MTGIVTNTNGDIDKNDDNSSGVSINVKALVKVIIFISSAVVIIVYMLKKRKEHREYVYNEYSLDLYRFELDTN